MEKGHQTKKKVFGFNIHPMSQCQCLKVNGQQCKNKASGQTLYCWQHQNCSSAMKTIPKTQALQKAQLVQKAQKPEPIKPKVQKTPIKKKVVDAPAFIDDSLFGPLPAKKMQSGYEKPMQPVEPIPLPPKKIAVKEPIVVASIAGKDMDSILNLINLPIVGYTKTKKLVQSVIQFKQMLYDFAILLDCLDSIETHSHISKTYINIYGATSIKCLSKLDADDKVDHSQDRISVSSGSKMIACATLSLYDMMQKSDSWFLLYDWIESDFSKSPNTDHKLIELLYILNEHCLDLQRLPHCISNTPYVRIIFDAGKTSIIDYKDIENRSVSTLIESIQDRPLHKFSRY